MIDEVRIDGGTVDTVLQAQVSAARLTMSRTQVPNLTLVVQDDHTLRLTSELDKVVRDTTEVTWGDWEFSPRKTKTGGTTTPTVTLTCLSLPVQKLRDQKGGKSWGNTDVSAWAKEVITTSGAEPYVQPALGEREIERKEPEGNNAEPETTFDVLSEMAKQVGAWLYVDGPRITLAKPSWLAAQPNTRRYEIVWNSWTDHTKALVNHAPEHEIDYDADPWDGRETLVVSLCDPTDGSSIARQARVGDILHYTGDAAPADPLWLITQVDLPQHWTEPTRLTCARPVDPPEIVPESKSSSSGEGTAGVPTGPIGAGGWTGEQLKMASEIVKEGQRRKLPTLAMELAVMTSMGESSLVNVGYGDNAINPDGTMNDSIGLFQQQERFDTGGHSRSDRLSPGKSAGIFYAALVKTHYEDTYNNGGPSVIHGGYYGPGKSANSASLAVHNVQRNQVPTHYAHLWADAQLVVRKCIEAGSSSTSGGKASGELGTKIDRLMSSYEGQYIDVDAAYGAQCYDLAQKFLTDLTGIGMIQANGKDFWRHPQLMGKFSAIPADQEPRKGDIVSWSGSSGSYVNGGFGHVAIFSHKVGGVMYFLSQNPSAARVQPLSRSGILGYMRVTG